MDNQFDFSSSSFQNKSMEVPNATAVLVLGIVSIVGCCCYGIGFVCSIIALVLAAKGRKAYAANPMQYRDGSLKNLNAGRVCAIVGIILFGLYIILTVVLIATGLYDKMQDPDFLREWVEQNQR